MQLTLPDYGQHIVFLGSTGSGKSYLAERMLAQFTTYLAIDTQNSLTLNGARLLTSPAHLAWCLKWYKRLRYAPKLQYRTRDTWNSIFATLDESSSKRKPSPRVVYIDEIYHLGYGASFPSWLPRAIATARQKKISYWISTQRPRQIPLPVLSEASRMFVFYLSREDDIKYVSSFARTDSQALYNALLVQQNDYSFIEIDVRKGSWARYSKLTN